MVIKHIVISGGGPTGLISYGALKALSEGGFWNLDDIETIVASSIGGFIAACISMGYSWKDLDDYLIKRPWEKAFCGIKTDLLEVMYNKGIDGESVFDICMSPLLRGRDLQEDITLKQLYEYNNINLCLTACEINEGNRFSLEVLSHSTHPELTLTKALACTAAFPFMFKPITVDEKCYLDGGVLSNFPLQTCLDIDGIDSQEILALRNTYENIEHIPITATTGFLDYARVLIRKTHKSLDNSSSEEYDIDNIISFDCSECANYGLWFQCIGDKELRERLVDRGISETEEWLSTQQQETV